MADRPSDDDLPPDPWADAAPPPPPPPPPQDPRGWHPTAPGPTGTGPPDAGPPGPGAPEHGASGWQPPARRTMWHHPALWVALLVVAAILFVTVLLEARPPAPSEPSPDAVEARSAR